MSSPDPTPDWFFANHFAIGFNDEEFLLQLGRMYEGQASPSIVLTAITTPRYARQLRDLLTDALERYDREREGPPWSAGSVTQ